MNNEIKIFNNPEFGEIRTVEINGEPYFVGKDVATALGYVDTNKAIATHVDEEDKLNDKTALSLGQRGGWFINESGLYSLIMSSKLPTAKKFKHWITSEVLPSIRKHGAYMTPETIEKALLTPDFLIKLATKLKEEQEKNKQLTEQNKLLEDKNNQLQIEINEQSEQIETLTPKADYCDKVLQSKSLIPISVIAKDYGKSAQWLNRYLQNKGIQYRQGNSWLLYSKYATKGYVGSRTHIIMSTSGISFTAKISTNWTQSGRHFIYETLKTDGVLPLFEQ